jgi:hypothetical protein
MSVFPTEILLKLLVKIYPCLTKIIPTAGDKYEYDYNVLAPLSMTAIPQIKLAWIIPTPFPCLPKDELPSQEWLALLLGIKSLLIEAKKQSNH